MLSPGRIAGDPEIGLAILTGFLGAGKSTRLARLLRQPEMANSAVIINEFGDVGIDHYLVDASDDRTVLLENGCLCCQIRDELSATLLRLFERRRAGELAFDRVVVETSGLADPGPLLAMLSPGGSLAGCYRRGAVCTMVEAWNGLETLQKMPGAARQVALADRIFVTKTDLCAPPGDLVDMLRQVNPEATICLDERDPTVDELFARTGTARRGYLAEWSPVPVDHIAGISAATIVERVPLPAAVVPLFLEGLAGHAGERLLRVKGIVNLKEVPDVPMLIQGARHREVERSWLERWPSDDHSTRISVIGFGIPPLWPAALLAALLAELRWMEGQPRG